MRGAELAAVDKTHDPAGRLALVRTFRMPGSTLCLRHAGDSFSMEVF